MMNFICKEMKSILLILPYFGKFPGIFPFWLESCRLNTTIDFLIVTDQNLEPQSSNIIVRRMNLTDIKARIEDYVGFEVYLEKAYKLCDFKPLYSYIFKEYVSKYDFWGYCDCDMIFGDIRHFITDELLDRYDYLLGMGHCHIQRVCDEKYENVWKSARGLWRDIQWKEVFRSDKNEWFDELPYGVAGRYYELYPERFWSGFAPEGRCYESPSSSYPYFYDIYNHIDVQRRTIEYTNHIDRLPFWVRKPAEELNHVVYEKCGIDLYAVGINREGNVIKRPILYTHFYKREFAFKTNDLRQYIIRPNVFIEYKKPSKIYLFFYSLALPVRLNIWRERIIQRITK